MIHAVVPVKSFRSAKTRLGGRLDEDQRACLAAASSRRVLDAVARTPAIARRIAVVEDAEGADLAARAHFEVLVRPDLWGQSAVVDAGFDLARERGATALLTVSADCPLVRPRDLEALLAVAPPALALVSDREGRGTNALLLNPARALRLHFGPDSLSRHRREAELAGVPVRVLDIPRLRLDVDTPEDLDALELSGPEGREVLIEAGQLYRDMLRDGLAIARPEGSAG